MSYQPNLFSSNAPNGSAEPAPKPAPQLLPEQHRTPTWLRRVDLFLRVIVRLYLGLLVVALPWTHLWDENHLFNLVPQIAWLADNGVVRLGDVEITAHYTPGHTPGSTTWTWQSCEGDRCLHMVYADSVTAIAAGNFRYSDPAHPERVQSYRRGLAVLAALPCDILVTPHPDQIDFLERVAQRDAGAKPDPVVNTQACRNYAAAGNRSLDAQLAKEKARQKASP